MITKESKKIVDSFLNDPQFQMLVEKDIGVPVKVKVIWEKGIIHFRGSLLSKELDIKDILDAHIKQRVN